MRGMKLIGAALGVMVILFVVFLWWTGLPPRRPASVSSSALHFEPNNVPFTLHKTGYWLDCWFDESANIDRCKLTDVRGAALFEDEFLPCDGQAPLSQRDLVFDARRTGYTWTGSYEKGISVPVIYLANGQILLPRSAYAEAKHHGGCS